jgi:beta-1,4-mannosyl-glycoprotein beta-1,4-N-acetylglucosaminyltransferase
MIIDTFPFNKDFNTLKIRLSELYDVVDLFVVAESAYTHTGKKKPLYLSENLHQFSKFSSKIKIVSNKRKYLTLNPRVREARQRELITRYLKSMKLTKKDLIIHSDCDEIPRGKTIADIKKTNTTCNILLELSAYSTRLNLYEGQWTRGRVVSGDLFKSIAKMRQDIFLFSHLDLRRHNFPLIQISDFFSHRYFGLWNLPQIVWKKPDITVIKNGGWHFNNLFKLDQIIEKIESSSHKEWNTEETKTKIFERHRLGQDVYTGKQFKIMPLDQSFPQCINENLVEWTDYILT